MSYLDNTGLAYFWQKIKSYVTGSIPTKVSELANDAGYITAAAAAPVQSVNGKTGAVVLNDLEYKGSASGLSLTDFDDITELGIYYINTNNLSNGPDENYQWSYLLEMRAPGGGYTVQAIFKPVSGKIWLREYSGSPGAWQGWKSLDSLGDATLASFSGRRIYISSGSPSGGSDGDLWVKY